MDKKICITCHKEKHIEDFCKNKVTKDGYSSKCKICSAKYLREWKFQNRIKNRLRNKTYNKKYYLENKDKIVKKVREYQSKNKSKLLKKNMEYEKNRIKTDPDYAMIKGIRRRIRYFLNYQSTYTNKNNKTKDIIGAELSFVTEYLNNMGYKKGMHIDHLIPLSVFDVFNKDHFKIMFNYRNLQPLSAGENYKKSNVLPSHWEDILISICKELNIDFTSIIKHIEKSFI